MQLASAFALLCTVALLAVTAYFLLGSVPLLTLQHDNPVDSHFIRSFYLTYYRIAIAVAIATAISYGLTGREALACGAATLAGLSWILRKKFIAQMDELSRQIQAENLLALAAFRKLHQSAIAIHLAQLASIVGCLGFM